LNTATVSILIASRNEEANILECLIATTQALPEAEVIVIDGGEDQTSELARQFAAQNPSVRVIKNRPDLGKGHAIKRGIDEARGTVMAQFDCDLQFDAVDLPLLLAPLLAGEADVAVGSRFLPAANRSTYKPIFYRDLGNRLLSMWMAVLVGHRVTDVTTGMKAWTKEAIQCIDFKDNRYSYEAEIVLKAHRHGLRVREIPVRYGSRVSGVSMHRNVFALLKAGLTIAGNCFIWRLTS
jgi:glycosyltransferase involved in cell wall biosynthesis